MSPRPDRTRLIVLAPVAGTSQAIQSRASEQLVIGLGPIQLPEYLDRPELVIRTSPNGFELSGANRWAEPLADNFRHVLSSDLARLLGNVDIHQYPWYPGTRLDYTVRVQVQRFEGDIKYGAELVARWEVRASPGEQVLASNEAELSQPLTSMAGNTIAGVLSDDLGGLAEQIAAAIAQLDEQRLARGPR